MLHRRVFAVTAAVLLAAAASAMASGLFLDRKDDRQAAEETGRAVHEETRSLGSLAYFRLQIDAQDQVRLLDQQIVDGEWRSRDVHSGARLYYEVLGDHGEVLVRGVRQDPRDDMRSNQRTPVNFILALPRERASHVVLYSMGYESGGRLDYEHSLRPIATLSMR